MVFHNVGIVSDCCEELDHGVLAVGYGEEVRSQPLVSCHALNSPFLQYMLLVLTSRELRLVTTCGGGEEEHDWLCCSDRNDFMALLQ